MPSLARPIVLAHGCFDLLHPGHLEHLRAARALGASLVVSITADRYASKAPGRPFYPEGKRLEMVSALRCVDHAFIVDGPDAVPAIFEIRPDIYAKGPDYAEGSDPGLLVEVEALRGVGGKIVYTDTPPMSSSAIINRVTDALTEEQRVYLERARGLGWREKIPELLARAASVQALFVGETIIDEYVYVSAMGKPPKEFVLACRENEREIFRGGVEAAAMHGRAVCLVDVWTVEAEQKTRFIDREFNRKLFEVYRKIDKGSSESRSELVFDSKTSPDLVVIFDFGHGMMTGPVRAHVETLGGFLAVNTQSNAANMGFNLITKYSGADYICLDAPEARLALGDPDIALDIAAEKLARRARVVCITDGRRGCWVLGAGGAMRIPAFSGAVVDTMGAGDAFLAVTAPLVYAGGDIEMVGFLGNIAGAIKVGMVGHRGFVTRERLERTAMTLLK